MPPEAGQSDAKKNKQVYIKQIMAELDKKIEELHAEGKTKAVASTGRLSGLAELNYNTIKKNNVFYAISDKYESVSYDRWQDLKIDVEKYIEERDIQ